MSFNLSKNFSLKEHPKLIFYLPTYKLPILQIDPKVLKQLKGVKDFKDFVKVFKPKGFTVKKRMVKIKVAKDKDDRVPTGPVIGISGIPDTSIGVSVGKPGD